MKRGAGLMIVARVKGDRDHVGRWLFIAAAQSDGDNAAGVIDAGDGHIEIAIVVGKLHSSRASHRRSVSGSRCVRSVAAGATIHGSSSSLPSIVGGDAMRIARTTLPLLSARCGSFGPNTSLSAGEVATSVCAML